MKKSFLILIFMLPAISFAKGDIADEAVQSAYQDYMRESQYFVTATKEVADSIRDWRKKKLAETFDIKLSLIEQNLSLSNQNLIEGFNKFLKENGVQSLDDVLLIRLAQLYFEKANLKFNQDMKSFQKQPNANQDIPVPNYDRTIRLSKKFLETFPQSPIADKALYMLGYCFEEMGKNTQSIDYYKQLLVQFPVSEYADEVTWRLAEIDYAQSNYHEAKNLYEKLSKTHGLFFTKAVYKLGATEVEQKDFKSASKTFLKLIQEIKLQNLTDLEDLDLNDEAMDYLATIMTHDPTIELNEDLKPELFYRMGLLYKKRLDEKSMRTVFIEATQKYSNSRFMPLYYSELIESFDSLQDDEHTNYYRSLLIQFLTGNQNWWAANDKYKKTIFQTQDLLEYNLLKSAEFYADKGYRKQDYNLLKIAKVRYSSFITKYSWSPYRDAAKLELADLEYYLGNYPVASNYYYEIVNESDSNLLREEAAYSLVWSEVKKVNYDLNFSAKNLNLANIQKTQFSLQEKTFVQAAQFYISNIKTSYRKNKILYKLSEINAEHGQLDDAANYLNIIISDTENSSAITVLAFKFLSEIYNYKGDSSSLASIHELYHTSLFNADVDSLDKDNFRQRYRDKLEAPINLEMRGQFLQAAQAFEAVAIANPDSPMSDFLNFKILDLYMKAAQFDRAETYINRVQASKYKGEALFMKAYMEYQLSQFESAANLFEEFSEKYPKHPWFTQAFLNVVNLRREMNQSEKVVLLTQRVPPSPSYAMAFYDKLDALLDLKKYDEVYKVVGALKKTQMFDDYYLEKFVLTAQLQRDDFTGAERSCTTINKIFEQDKLKAANLVYDKSLCEYLKIKTLDTQTQTTLDDLVGQLNKVYTLKIDDVTLAALNDVISKSPLKESNKSQFVQLMDKGWSMARKYPLHKESIQLSQNILKEQNKLPMSLAYLQNWNISFADMLEFKPLVEKNEKWPEIKLACDVKSYAECLRGLEAMYEETPSSGILENILIASLKAQDDDTFHEYLRKYSTKNDTAEKANVWTVLTSHSSKDILVNNDDPRSQIAKNVSLFYQGERTLGIDGLRKMIVENAKSQEVYLFLARMYFEKDQPELALNVLANGYKNTTSRSLLPAIYQMNALIYSNTSYSDVDGNQDQSPALQFAIAFSALKSKDSKRVEMVLNTTKKLKNWYDMIKSAQLAYASPKEFASEAQTSSDYVRWVRNVYQLAQGDLSHLEDVKTFANQKGFSMNYGCIEKTMSERAIAAEKK